VWFGLGRWWGRPTLRFICKVALEPDSCVSQTEGLLLRRGLPSLLFAKFIPGFDTVAPALAGLLRVGVVRFSLWSAAGALIWLAAFGGLGYAMSGAIDRLVTKAEGLGGVLGIGVVVVFAAFVGWKWLRRRGVLKSIRMARIAPEELHQLISGGKNPAIVDVRAAEAVEVLPVAIPGALFISLEELDARAGEIPRDRDVVFYCT
jgi:hypothetical protein